MSVRLLIFVPLLALATQASAQTTTPATGSFDVVITVRDTCNIVSADTIDFGDVDVGITPSSVIAEGDITLTCSLGTEYELGLSGGGGSNVSARRMLHTTSSSNEISYELFRDAPRQDPWQDINSGETVTDQGRGAGVPVEHTVYARANLAGNELPGDYSDTITVTLKF